MRTTLPMAVNLADLSKSGVRTESDVEQKLILPLLTASEWLGIPTTDIQTKQYLPPTQIDKGAGRRIGYYPDYSIWISAVPIMIVEAKSPIESAEEGFREAQLYAHELNKVFPTGINPVQFVLCVNGRTLRCGYWDSTQIKGPVCCRSEARYGRASRFRSFIGYDALKREAATITQRFRPTQTYRPINFAGGEQALKAYRVKQFFDRHCPFGQNVL
jgi:type I site-specific restriction endonuclease